MRHSEHLLTKFLFRLSWEKSNWLELLEGLKSQELNRSVLPGVDLLGWIYQGWKFEAKFEA